MHVIKSKGGRNTRKGVRNTPGLRIYMNKNFPTATLDGTREFTKFNPTEI
jgi:hypothetical protein